MGSGCSLVEEDKAGPADLDEQHKVSRMRQTRAAITFTSPSTWPWDQRGDVSRADYSVLNMDAGKHAAVKREVLSVWSKKAYVLNVNKRLQRHKPEGISLEQNEQSQLCPPTQPAPLDHHGKLQWLDPSIVI